MNFVIIDVRGNFLSDVKSRLDIFDDIGVNIVATYANIEGYLSNPVPTQAVLIADNIIESPNFTVPTNAPVYAYQTKPEGAGIIAQRQLPLIGFSHSTQELIDMMVSMSNRAPQSAPTQTMTPQPQSAPPQYYQHEQQTQYQSPYPQMSQPQAAQPQPLPQYQQPMPQPQYPQQYQMPPERPQYQMPPEQPQYQMPPEQPQYQMPPEQPQYYPQGYPQTSQYQAPPELTPQYPQGQYQQETQQYSQSPYSPQMPQQPQYQPIEPPFSPEKKAKTVAVYSAKGGVGKTTLASEIAAYLSITCSGRGHFRVCIVDYNIDFGDVSTTLGLEPNGVNMSIWSSEIMERLGKGQSTNYTAKDIEENFLQKKEFAEGIELYALAAPSTHEDSTDITEEALDIMLKNLVYNGDFDFVVCDTGNNTRDSSLFALDYADYIFLVVTQDITTINCNDSFIAAMRHTGFDESRIKMVINNITSSKDTGISVDEIEKFVNYPCVAHIKRNSDVIKANNQSIPLVFKTNHEFTKELRNIISCLVTDEEDLTTQKKKKFSFFGTKKK